MSEVHSAVGSYVINALDGAELDDFEAHLAVCETCTREVGEFSETVAELAVLTATPPPALRGTILAAIKEVRPLPPSFAGAPETWTAAVLGSTGDQPPTGSPTDAERTGASAPDRAASAETDAASGRSDAGLAPVVDLRLWRARRRGRMLIAGIAAALVVALGLGGWAYSLVRARDAQVAAAQRETQLETQLFSASDVRVVATTMANGGQVSFVSSKTLNRALFIGTNLPETGPGKRYQLWTLTPAAQPDNLFDGGASRKQWFRNSITDAGALAVTIEPSGGSPQPTGTIQASAKI